jgi:hypothetical protein
MILHVHIYVIYICKPSRDLIPEQSLPMCEQPSSVCLVAQPCQIVFARRRSV